MDFTVELSACAMCHREGKGNDRTESTPNTDT